MTEPHGQGPRHHVLQPLVAVPPPVCGVRAQEPARAVAPPAARRVCETSWMLRVWSLGFGVWGLGFGVWGLGFGVWGLGFGVWGFRFGVWGLGFGVWGLGWGMGGWILRMKGWELGFRGQVLRGKSR
jgi:hypothetical protein